MYHIHHDMQNQCVLRNYFHIKNSDGSYVDSLYQVSSNYSNHKYISDKVDKIFSSELRDIKIQSILYV